MTRELKKIFGILIVFSICLLGSNFAEAKAQISWTTTDVILESGKCTVRGYFTNTGDVGGIVTNIHFVIDVINGKNKNIYSDVWDSSPKDCYIAPGAQRAWSFSLSDKGCPRYTAKDKTWNVMSSVTCK